MTVFSIFDREAGVHRIQRVPHSEKRGRMHTSTATVSVLQNIDSNKTVVKESDTSIYYSKSSGNGGQHINKTNNCVRIVHNPTGLMAVCQNERSQGQNREMALKILCARVEEYNNNKIIEEQNNNRKKQIGNADRCNKIRTYNESEDRIVDHRTGKKIHGFKRFMNGEYIK